MSSPIGTRAASIKGHVLGANASYNVILRAFVAISTYFANVLLHISRFVSPMSATEQARLLRALEFILIAIPLLASLKRARSSDLPVPGNLARSLWRSLGANSEFDRAGIQLSILARLTVDLWLGETSGAPTQSSFIIGKPSLDCAGRIKQTQVCSLAQLA